MTPNIFPVEGLIVIHHIVLVWSRSQRARELFRDEAQKSESADVQRERIKIKTLKHILEKIRKFSTVADALPRSSEEFKQAASKASNMLANSAQGLSSTVENLEKQTSSILSEMKQELESTMGEVKRIVEEMKAMLESSSTNLLSSSVALTNAVDGFKTQVKLALDDVKTAISDAIKESANIIKQGTEETSSQLRTALNDQMQEFRKETQQAFNDLNKTLEEPIVALKNYAGKMSAALGELRVEYGKSNEINDRLTRIMQEMSSVVTRAKLQIESPLFEREPEGIAEKTGDAKAAAEVSEPPENHLETFGNKVEVNDAATSET